MHFSKDTVVSNTAGAAIRQLVPLIFEKALEESKVAAAEGWEGMFLFCGGRRHGSRTL